MNTFPNKKIKAQILRDEDVGRVSSKAIELIAACSALFVRDLVDVGDGAGDGKNATTNAPSSRRTSSRKRNSPSIRTNRIEKDLAGLVVPSPIDLQHIKMQAKRPEYDDFLDGVLEGITEKGVAMVRKRAMGRKRKRNVDQKQEKLSKQNENIGENENKEADESMLKHLPLAANEAAGSTCDRNALTEAIDEAQGAPVVAGNQEIIEDEDEYD